MTNKWFVITGGPSSGKTTLLNELSKLGYKTVPEAARAVIDEAAAKGISATELRKNEKLFQEKVTRLKEKNEAAARPNEITFFDRGMHDTIAYLRNYSFKIEDWVENLTRQSRYKKVFLLEPLAHYQKDYARVESDDFPRKIHRLLDEVYTQYDLAPIKVPAMKIKERVKFILENVSEGPASEQT